MNTRLERAARQLLEAGNRDTPEMWEELRDALDAPDAQGDDAHIYKLTRADVRETARQLWGDTAAAALTEEHFEEAQRWIANWVGDVPYSWVDCLKDALRETGKPKES